MASLIILASLFVPKLDSVSQIILSNNWQPQTTLLFSFSSFFVEQWLIFRMFCDVRSIIIHNKTKSIFFVYIENNIHTLNLHFNPILRWILQVDILESKLKGIFNNHNFLLINYMTHFIPSHNFTFSWIIKRLEIFVQIFFWLSISCLLYLSLIKICIRSFMPTYKFLCHLCHKILDSSAYKY